MKHSQATIDLVTKERELVLSRRLASGHSMAMAYALKAQWEKLDWLIETMERQNKESGS